MQRIVLILLLTISGLALGYNPAQPITPANPFPGSVSGGYDPTRPVSNTNPLAMAVSGVVTGISINSASGVSGSCAGASSVSCTITLGNISPASIAASGTVSATTLSASGVSSASSFSGSASGLTNIPMSEASGVLGFVNGGTGSTSAASAVVALGAVTPISQWAGTTGGSTTAYTLTPATPIAAYADGQRWIFTAHATNTSAGSTFAVSGLAALPSTMGSVAMPIGGLLINNKYWGLVESGGTAIRISPYDSVSVNGDTINGILTIGAAGGLQAPYLYFTNGGLFSSPGSSQVQLGTVDVPTPLMQTLSITSAVGVSNIPGVDWVLQGSRGTGTGIGGNIVFKTAPAGVSGTAQNTAVPTVTISPNGYIGSSKINPLSTPSAPAGTPSATGGTIAASTTNYATIVALDALGSVVGTQSAAVTTTGTTSSIAWAWTAVAGAINYQIWVSQTASVYGFYFTSTTTAYLQTLPHTSGTAGTIPVANTSGALTVAGEITGRGWVQSIKTVTAAYTIQTNDYTILADATGAAFSVTLPTAASAYNSGTATGDIYVIQRINAGANAVTLQAAGAELINGVNTQVLNAQWTSVTVQSNGTSWFMR